MSARGTVLVSICVALVALPLSPCAFFTSGCRQHQQQAKVEVKPAPQGSCCADNDEPARDQSQPRREPCPGDCCRTGPFVPVGEKLLPASQPAALLAVLPLLDNASAGGMAPVAIAIGQPLSLHILHCQWRC